MSHRTFFRRVACCVLLLACAVGMARADMVAYSDLASYSGSAIYNGGATLQGANTITRMVADDLTLAPGSTGWGMTSMSFAVANQDAAPVNARIRVRFYNSDGSGGGPGSILAGYSYNAISFPVGVTIYTGNVTPTMIIPASGKIWYGFLFDNNSGATGATATQLDNLGVGFFNAPTVGSSADELFQTTAAGSFLVNNPAGSITNMGGAPVANLGLALNVVPLPGAMGMGGMALGALGLLRRRRTAA